MSKYIHFTEEQKEQANNIDLEQYLRSRGESFLKSGREKRLKSDKSITIRGNEWFDHSSEKGGYAIDFMKMYYGLDFPSAMTELIGDTNNLVTHKSYEKEEEPPKIFTLPPKNQTLKKVFAYLTKHRGIDSSVLSFFVKENLIYESKEILKNSPKEYNNIVFLGVDNDGKPAHAHKRSVYSTGKKFMQNIEGSNPKHSFHYLGGSDRLYVFEAPIDMLSFISIHKNTNWKKHNYVALCGVSSWAMIEQIEQNNNINHVVLCLDNDKAGHETCKRFEELLAEKKVSRIIPQTKDFNEDLKLQTEEVNQNYTMKMR